MHKDLIHIQILWKDLFENNIRIKMDLLKSTLEELEVSNKVLLKDDSTGLYFKINS